jgi:hypothetical protein
VNVNKSDREARLAEALRANLKRRKQQQKARSDADGDQSEGETTRAGQRAADPEGAPAQSTKENG